MNNTLRDNLTKIRRGLVRAMPSIEERYIMSIFTKTASAVFSWIDDHPAYYEDQTYNLRDSIGVGAYKNGVLVNWIQTPAKKATKAKKFSPRDSNYYIEVNGRDLLTKAISNPKYASIADYSLVLYAMAPYGIIVEDGGGKRGTGWWTEGLVPYVRERFEYEISNLKRK